VDLNGVVDLRDCIVLNKYMANIVTLSDQAAKNADVDVSGQLDDNDASILLQFSIMLVETLPVVSE
jgi:shikimate kinase